jgi:hypothetical protein
MREVSKKEKFVLEGINSLKKVDKTTVTPGEGRLYEMPGDIGIQV